MAVDNGLDFFGVDFETADVDDPVSSADKVIALVAQFDHVACVDKAVVVSKPLGGTAEVTDCGSGRTDAERAILDLHLDVGASIADQSCGKTCKTIADVETDPRLRGSERMDNPGVRVERLQIVQYYLVHYLSRQPNVSGCNSVGRRTHQRTTPMGRSAGNMCYTMGTRPGQEVTGRLPGARQNERCAVEKRAKNNLQAPIAANVIEGAPDNGGSYIPVALDGTGEAREGVQSQFRRAGRSRSKEDPFRLVAFAPIEIGADKIGTAGYVTSYAGYAGVGGGFGLIGHHRICAGG